MKVLFVLTLFTLLVGFDSAQAKVDASLVETEMKNGGAVGWLHGVVAERNIAVFTYRNPNDFFDYVILPATSSDPTVYADLLKMKRNQKVRVFGQIISNRAPIKHLDISKIELIKDFVSDLDNRPHSYSAKDIDYKNMNTLTGRVHAIDPGGKVLVIEYKDLVTPVFVQAPQDLDLVKTLYRGDKIKLNYIVRGHPGSPVHLAPQPIDSNKPAIEIIEKIKDMNGRKIVQDGFLVRFPKSPEIIFDVYAVLSEDSEGTNLQFTLVNFDDPELFKKLRAKLETLWKRDTSKIENGRNKLINRGVRIRATGLGNVKDQSQANAQILINSLDDITLL